MTTTTTIPPVDPSPSDDLAPVYALAMRLLSAGFRASAVVLAVGVGVAIAKQEPLNHRADAFADVIPAILDGKAAGLIDLAILLMLATPVATTLGVAVAFARLGDRRYAGLSIAVLAILAVSASLALFGGD